MTARTTIAACVLVAVFATALYSADRVDSSRNMHWGKFVSIGSLER